jgi:hypothetical protein
MCYDRLAVRSIAGLALLLMAACSSPAGPAEDLAVTRITSGAFSNFTTPQRRVIRSQESLLAAWNQVFEGGILVLPPPLPDVDFSTEMVILVAAGQKPTSGYCIAVEGAAGDSREATVSVLTSTPPPGGVATVLTQPFDMVRMESRDDVTFEERSQAGSCG